MLKNRKIVTFIQLEQSTNSPNVYIKTLESILGGYFNSKLWRYIFHSDSNGGRGEPLAVRSKVNAIVILPSQHGSHHETYLSSL